MAVTSPGNKPASAPKSAPAEAPRNEPKKPPDNSAAKQSPDETKKAVENSFGKVPSRDNGKTPGNASKEPAAGPKGPVEVPKKNLEFPPAKAAGDVKPENVAVTVDRNNNKVASDPYTGEVVRNDMGHAYAVGDDGKYIKTEDGKDVVVNRYNGKLAAADPNNAANGGIATDKGGNPYIVQPDGKYVTLEGPPLVRPDGSSDKTGTYYAVYEKGNGYQPAASSAETGGLMKAGPTDGAPSRAIDPKTGAILKGIYTPDGKLIVPEKTDNTGNPYIANANGDFATTPDGKYIAYGKDVGGNPIAVDPASNKPVSVDKYPIALDANGNTLKTPTGQPVVYDPDNGGKLAVPSTQPNTVASDGSGNPYAIAPDGKFAQTEDGNYVVYDKANGNNMIAIDNKTGQAITDGKGRPLALDENGKYLKTPDGNTIVYEKVGNKFNPVAADKNGDLIAINGKPAAVDKDGNYLTAPDGNAVVYDAKGNPVAQDKDGKGVTDDKGNALAIDKNGNYMLGVTYDKDTGLMTTAEGYAVDDAGNPVKDKNGNYATTSPAGTPAFPTGEKTTSGFPIYKDAKTGELQTWTPNGAVYMVDQKINDLAKDASGKYLPPVYEPVSGDPSRPPVGPNQDPETTVKNLPQGAQRGDPAAIKDTLFDRFGNLSNEKLIKALETYDALDVYDALIASGKAGGWDQLNADGKAIRPDAEQARQAIGALLAWQNENGQYNPITGGKVPSVVFYKGGPNEPAAKAGDNDALYINVDSEQPATSSIFNALTKSKASDGFKQNYQAADNPSLDTVTEYLANNWTGNNNDTADEVKAHADFKVLDDAVANLGNGDRNTGLDMLKKAYFAGDVRAIKMLNDYMSSLKPSRELP